MDLLPLLRRSVLVVALGLTWGGEYLAAEPGFTVTQTAPAGIYAVGEPITWNVLLHDVADPKSAVVTYTVLQGGLTTLAKGTLPADGRITATLDVPGTVLLNLSAKLPGVDKALIGAGGAVAEPRKIAPAEPIPDDFTAFWDGKLAAQNAIPMNPQFEKKPGGKAGIDYGHLTLDTINNSHIRGQLARPADGKKHPAVLIVQYAGVYPLKPDWVTGYAGGGWLALNILAHDQPIDEPAKFYEDLSAGALKSYTAIGNEDREKSYFLRMFLACSRAVDYLALQPDWDGKTLIVTGVSQGGLQAIVAAGLNPKVTGILINVPAGCDNNAELAGRKPGWPYWLAKVDDPKKAGEVARYFDAVHFAARIRCPALVGVGLLDVTARPAGIFAAINQMQGPTEVVVMPEATHKTDHTPFNVRKNAWESLLRSGKPLLVGPSPAGHLP